MKMVKKILLGLALAGTVLALAGCSMGDDKQMDTKGTKWDFDATIDHVNIKKDKQYETDKLYRRAWTQLGSNETVSKIKTTLTISTEAVSSKVKLASDTAAATAAKDLYNKTITSQPTEAADKFYTLDNSSGDPNANAVVGFLFDLHKSTVDNKTVYDFVLLGIQVSTGKYYVERYTNVPENAMKDPTSLGSLWSGVNANNCQFLDEKNVNNTADKNKYSDSIPYHPTNKITFDGVDNAKKTKTLVVEVTQDNVGTYVLKFGGITVNYTRPAGTKDKDGVLCGGAGIYSNAPLGTIANIHSDVDKENTKGLYEEVEE